MTRRICTIIESPYAGDVKANVEYAIRCCKDSLSMGEAPFASHLFYTLPGMLDDNIPEERKLGIESGFAWGDEAAEVVAFYIDRGVSNGMRSAFQRRIGWVGHDSAIIQIRSIERTLSTKEQAEWFARLAATSAL